MDGNKEISIDQLDNVNGGMGIGVGGIGTEGRVINIIAGLKKINITDAAKGGFLQGAIANTGVAMSDIASRIEQEFGIKIPECDFSKILTIEDLVKYIDTPVL